VGRIVVTEFVSLDGVVEDPGGSEGTPFGGWAFKFDRGDEGNKFKLDELMAADAQLLGRVTYEGFAAAWPSRTGDEFSEKMNSMPKYVFSNTLSEATWENSHIVTGDFAQEISKLREEAGDLLVAGSIQLVNGLAEHGLVDEYRLMVYPTVLGQGKRLWAKGVQANLELVDARPAADTLLLTYHRAAV
jgi:dihydrofolate reductase